MEPLDRHTMHAGGYSMIVRNRRQTTPEHCEERVEKLRNSPGNGLRYGLR
jgi:hypothetical protein